MSNINPCCYVNDDSPTLPDYRFYVYYIDRNVELKYTWFHTYEEATRIAKIIGGYVK